MGIYKNDFCVVFTELLKKSGVSCYEISHFAHLDEAYLSRLRSGEKNNPSPEVIMRICLAVAHCSKKDKKVRLFDFEALFNAVGRSLFTAKVSSL